MADRAHGTRTKYVHEKCRCEPCTIANRTYQQQYMKGKYVSGIGYVKLLFKFKM